MSETDDLAPEVLDPSADPMSERLDHPDDLLSDDEAAAGDVVYHEVDDLDDDSNGLD